MAHSVGAFKAALGWDIFGKLSQQIFTFGVGLILARVLTPIDFGFVALILVVFRILEVFTDIGFSSAVIQKQVDDEKILNSAFTFNLLITIGLFLLVLFYAKPIALILGNKSMEFGIRVLSIPFLFDGLTNIHKTIWKKNLQFKFLTKVMVLADVIGGGISLTIAYIYHSYWAIIVQLLVVSVIRNFCFVYFNDWKPKIALDWKDIKGIMSFSIFVFFQQLVNRVSSRFETIVIGRVFSLEILGLYNRSESTVALIRRYSTSSLFKVFFPFMSSFGNDKLKLLERFLQVFEVSLYLLLIFVLPLYLMGERLIIFLYGENWAQAGEYFEYAILLVFFLPFNSLISSTLLSQGFSRVTFLLACLNVSLRLTSLYFGYLFGVFTFLKVMIISSIILFIIHGLVMQFYLNLKFVKLLSVILKYSWLLLLVLIIYFNFDINGFFLKELILVISYLFLFFLFSYVFKNPSFMLIIREVRGVLEKIYRKVHG